MFDFWVWLRLSLNPFSPIEYLEKIIKRFSNVRAALDSKYFICRLATVNPIDTYLRLKICVVLGKFSTKNGYQSNFHTKSESDMICFFKYLLNLCFTRFKNHLKHLFIGFKLYCKLCSHKIINILSFGRCEDVCRNTSSVHLTRQYIDIYHILHVKGIPVHSLYRIRITIVKGILY